MPCVRRGHRTIFATGYHRGYPAKAALQKIHGNQVIMAADMKTRPPRLCLRQGSSASGTLIAGTVKNRKDARIAKMPGNKELEPMRVAA
jgi:hypothetical protein